MIKTSAPGKVHLIGEHAVVYSEPAIIAAIGNRTYVDISPAKDITYQDIAWPDISHTWKVEQVFEITQKTFDLWKEGNEKKDFSKLFSFIKENGYEGYRASVLGLAMKNLGINQGFSITIDSKIPTGAGLGSSASRAVAMTKAIAELFEKELSLEEINEIAFQQEKIIHGTPSGGDNSACCFGGLVWFKKDQPKNQINSLKEEVPYKLENFVFVYTGPPQKTTGELVQLVRELDEGYRTERIKKIGEMTYEMLDVLRRRNFQRMKEIINQTQKNLAELKISTEKIDQIAESVQEIGGAAKLCGAGSGGIVLCYHQDKGKLIDLIKNIGYDPWETELAVEGVRIEKTEE
ncbi:MAG: mevalonate kinase [Candidatus Nealsonbacteria bacterium CG10_big_fil_rev_8_21_14_0_10_37_25]|uniref:mevalonate kinase n=2 Tax=Candidatus Nealsoniibacteriota TaxID=1817911 RepID=A0A2H0TIW6_9BACT|nr:MAG: mevalonate kinase [Candidatus Nealsonbacteria bacterium CG10_big_fil_rev_8_21_14_0_10_37_25]